VSAAELVALVCCDLGAIVRGRSLPASELQAHLAAGVGWVPANHALTPLGPLAEPNPFGSTGDLRLLPDIDTRARVGPGGGVGAVSGGTDDANGETAVGASALDLVLCDIVETDGRPWECCPRQFLRDALTELERDHGLRLVASFEHEFQLLGGPRSCECPPALPFSLDAQREAEPFAAEVMGALSEAGVQPERFYAEYASRQFEIPVQPAQGVAGADRSVVLTQVVREIARRRGLRASFTPLLDPAQAGNGAHIHLSLLDASGDPALYDVTRPGCLSELGERFAAGILLHARALTALTAPSPVSSMRLAPHHWSAGAVCVGQRNRECLLRLPPLISLGGGGGAGDGDGGDRSKTGGVPDRPARQLRLEYRGADASANPYLALGAIVRAGLDGIRAALPAPPILDRDPSELDAVESERYGVGALSGSLTDSLEALAQDATARAWMAPLMYEAYVAVKRAEIEATADWDIERLTERYASIY
jgi:glutamine synthetase